MKLLIENEDKIKGKNVLLRIDADVPIKDGVVIDDERIKASIPTIEYLLERGAKVTIIGHIGRPKGKEVPELKMLPIEDKLIELLGSHRNWQILENLRFNKGEEENDLEFAKQLAAGQDVFVNDAFATMHRSHASTVGIAKILPSFAGKSVEYEVENIQKILDSPKDGFTIIIGGKKAETKLPVIENLFDKAENFLVGGVVGSTFLAAQGYTLGKSLVEKEVYEETRKIIEKFKADSTKKLLIPMDLVFSKSLEQAEGVKTLSVEELKDLDSYFAVDIGQNTIHNFKEIINVSDTIFWNGNMGVSEVPDFSNGTMRIAEAVTNAQLRKYAGGGDTSTFLRQAGIADNFDFISKAGGATLEYLAGKKLPGLEVLE